jgi:hypothetical protein
MTAVWQRLPLDVRRSLSSEAAGGLPAARLLQALPEALPRASARHITPLLRFEGV